MVPEGVLLPGALSYGTQSVWPSFGAVISREICAAGTDVWNGLGIIPIFSMSLLGMLFSKMNVE